MLDVNLKEQLQTYLKLITRQVEIVAHPNASEESKDMMGLLSEIVSLSSQISLREVLESSVRSPSFSLNSPGHEIHLSFAGIPLGHEFTSLVLALLQVGGYPSKQPAELLESVRSIKGDYSFETYFSQSCQNCPDVVQALNLMAVLNPNIKHVAIDGAFFPDEVENRGVMTVPSVYLNGVLWGQGRMDLAQIVSKLDVSSDEKKLDELNKKDTFDVLVIGGGPAGSAASIYSARKGIKTGLIAERLGGQVLDTMAIENLISIQETDGPKLAQSMKNNVQGYGVDIIENQKVIALKNIDSVFSVTLGCGATIRSKSLVLAPGARWRQMNVPGEEQYRNKGVAYCPHCDGPLFKGKRVAVVGGGNSGVEAAIDLAGITEHVVLLEFASTLRADQVLQKKLHSLPNVEVITDALTTEVLGDGKKMTGLVYQHRVTSKAQQLNVSGVFVQIGLLPNTDWLEDVVVLNERKEIVIDSHGATNIPGVFAAGDATDTPYKQIIISMGDGAKASLSAFDYLIRTT